MNEFRREAYFDWSGSRLYEVDSSDPVASNRWRLCPSFFASCRSPLFHVKAFFLSENRIVLPAPFQAFPLLQPSFRPMQVAAQFLFGSILRFLSPSKSSGSRPCLLFGTRRRFLDVPSSHCSRDIMGFSITRTAPLSTILRVNCAATRRISGRRVLREAGRCTCCEDPSGRR